MGLPNCDVCGHELSPLFGSVTFCKNECDRLQNHKSPNSYTEIASSTLAFKELVAETGIPVITAQQGIGVFDWKLSYTKMDLCRSILNSPTSDIKVLAKQVIKLQPEIKSIELPAPGCMHIVLHSNCVPADIALSFKFSATKITSVVDEDVVVFKDIT